jgi:hypothetical protein
MRFRKLEMPFTTMEMRFGAKEMAFTTTEMRTGRLYMPDGENQYALSIDLSYLCMPLL